MKKCAGLSGHRDAETLDLNSCVSPDRARLLANQRLLRAS